MGKGQKTFPVISIIVLFFGERKKQDSGEAKDKRHKPKATISINIRPEINNSPKEQTEPKETLTIRGISALRVCSSGAMGSYGQLCALEQMLCP